MKVLDDCSRTRGNPFGEVCMYGRWLTRTKEKGKAGRVISQFSRVIVYWKLGGYLRAQTKRYLRFEC